MTTILIKKRDTTGAPATADLTNAAGGTEIAVNTYDKRIYTKTSSSEIVELGTNPSSITITAVNGGTPSIGQILIGNGTGMTRSTITAGSGVIVTNGTGSITIAASGTPLAGFTSGTLTALGTSALSSVTSANYATAVGYEALKSVTTGSWNTGVGYQAGKSITSGIANTFVGYGSGSGITTSSANVAIGDSAYTGTNYGYSMCLGQASQVTGGNQNQIGGSGTTTYAYGAVQDRSDARDKTDIQNTDLGLNFVMALRPVKFKWDMRDDYRPKPPAPDASESEWEAYRQAADLSNITHDGTHTRTRYHQGLIAQEVKATMDAMGVDFGGFQDHSIKGGQNVMSIGYNEMIAPLIKAIQELKAEFDAYKASHP